MNRPDHSSGSTPPVSRALFGLLLTLLGLIAVGLLWLDAPREAHSNTAGLPEPGLGFEADESIEAHSSHEAEAQRGAVSEGLPEDTEDSSTVNEPALVLARGEAGERLPGSRLIFESEREVFAADGQGNILIVDAERIGRRFVLAAPGHHPRTGRLRSGEQSLPMARDFGFELDLQWADGDGEVLGAEVFRLPRRFTPPRDYGWARDLLPQVLDPPTGTDQGRIRIPGVFLDKTAVELEVRHPQARTLLLSVWHNQHLDSRRTAVVKLRLHRDAQARIVRIVSEDGQPLAHRRAWSEIERVRREHRSDANGRIEFNFDAQRPPVLIGQLWVEQSPELGWYGYDNFELVDWETELVVRRPPASVGHIDGPQPNKFEIALAHATHPDRRDVAFFATPNPLDRLPWTPIGADGRYRLPAGFRGEDACLLLRHRATRQLVDWQLLKPDTDTVLEAPPVHHVSLTWELPSHPLAGEVRFLPVDEDGRPRGAYSLFEPELRFPLSSLPTTLELVEDRYRVDVLQEGLRWPLAICEVENSATQWSFTWPERSRATGVVVGSLSGPMGGVRVRASTPDQSKRPTYWGLSTIHWTRADGRFEFAVPKVERIHLNLKPPADEANPWFSKWAQHWQVLDPNSETLVELAESRLEVVIPNWLASVHAPALWLYRAPKRSQRDAAVRTGLTGGFEIPMRAESQQLSLRVPPGDYVVSIGKANSSRFLIEVSVDKGRNALVEFPSLPPQPVFVTMDMPLEYGYFLEVRKEGDASERGQWQRVQLFGKQTIELLLGGGRHSFRVVDVRRPTLEEQQQALASLMVDVEAGVYCEVGVRMHEKQVRLTRED